MFIRRQFILLLHVQMANLSIKEIIDFSKNIHVLVYPQKPY